jgi:hypothetical protein
MKELQFRAECQIDITRFIHLLYYGNHNIDLGEFEIWQSNNICSVKMEEDIDIDFFKNIAANVVDGHIMLQTMNWNHFANRNWEAYEELQQSKYFCEITCDVPVDWG